MTKAKLRILFVADVPPDQDSGAAGTEWQTIQALRRLGHEVDEIWADDLPHRITHGNLHYLLELPRAYRDAINDRCRQGEYDVFHVNQGHCYLAAHNHLFRKRNGVFVCRSHGLDDHMEKVLRPWRTNLGVPGRRGLKSTFGWLVDALLYRHDRLAYRYASGIIVSSGLDREYLVRQHVPEGRVASIPQAPAQSFTESPVIPMGPDRLKRILHVGGFAYWKGVHAVASAVNTLLAGDSDLRMTWVCRVHEHEQVRALLVPEVARKVELIGWVTQAELMGIYDRHGIFLAPSLFDGFGKVFLEAMARGLCVVGTPTGGMRDIIQSGKNGFLVGFHDPEGIVSVVRRLAAETSLGLAVSRKAALDAREYSWDRVGLETAEFYKRLIDMEPRLIP